MTECFEKRFKDLRSAEIKERQLKVEVGNMMIIPKLGDGEFHSKGLTWSYDVSEV